MTKATKTIPVRFDDEAVWLEFRQKLLQNGVSAQQFFIEKVEEYLKPAQPEKREEKIMLLKEKYSRVPELAEELGRIPVSMIDEGDLEQLVSELQEQGYNCYLDSSTDYLICELVNKDED